jgi:hypothetical protein
MSDQAETRYVDSSRLKQVNLELGQLAGKHKSCRVNSGLFSGLGAVILAISVLGLIHIFPAGADDWTQNPNSPVYEIAVERETHFTLKAALVGLGFFAGLAFVVTARQQCVRQRSLWKRESDLRSEMREIRDQLYILDQAQAYPSRPKHQVATHEQPLDAVEARGEYVGVYNPPKGRRESRPENA